MENVTTTILLGATGGINGGLLAAGALDKLHLASVSNGTALVMITGAIAGMALVAAFRATVAVLSEVAPQQQVI